MTVAQVIFQIYILMSTLLLSSETMHRPECYSIKDKLYSIEAYANYQKDNHSYIAFVKQKQECIFNNTPFYHMSLINISNISNGTFIPTFDSHSIERARISGGRFK